MRLLIGFGRLIIFDFFLSIDSFRGICNPLSSLSGVDFPRSFVIAYTLFFRYSNRGFLFVTSIDLLGSLLGIAVGVLVSVTLGGTLKGSF